MNRYYVIEKQYRPVRKEQIQNKTKLWHKIEKKIENYLFDVLLDGVQLEFFVDLHLGVGPPVDLDHHVSHRGVTGVRVQRNVVEGRQKLVT